MPLEALILAVKEEHLTKTQLELYRDALTNLFAEMKLEVARLEKEEALFLLGNDEISHVAKERQWKGTEHGQRLIELDHHTTIVSKLYDSVKSRLYSLY